MSGPCVEQGQCVHSANYPNHYGDHEHCILRPVRDQPLRVEAFDTERGYDHLTINGHEYSGSHTSIPQDIVPDRDINWRSDDASTRPGWLICQDGNETRRPHSPPAPAPPPPPLPSPLPLPPPPAPIPGMGSVGWLTLGDLCVGGSGEVRKHNSRFPNPNEVPCSSDSSNAEGGGMYDGLIKHVQVYSQEVSFVAQPRSPPQGPPPLPPPPLSRPPGGWGVSSGGGGRGGALSGGAIAAIVSGGVAVFALLVLLVLRFRSQSVQLAHIQAPHSATAPAHPRTHTSTPDPSPFACPDSHLLLR